MAIVWQTNWRRWQWPWYSATLLRSLGLKSNYVGAGPFQFHWYSSAPYAGSKPNGEAASSEGREPDNVQGTGGVSDE